MYYSPWNDSFSTSFAQTAWDHGAYVLVQLQPDGVTLASVAASGSDAYLRAYADAVVAFGHPVILSFGHEMNGTWYLPGQISPRVAPPVAARPGAAPLGGGATAYIENFDYATRRRFSDFSIVRAWSAPSGCPGVSPADTRIQSCSSLPRPVLPRLRRRRRPARGKWARTCPVARGPHSRRLPSDRDRAVAHRHADGTVTTGPCAWLTTAWMTRAGLGIGLPCLPSTTRSALSDRSASTRPG